MCSLRTVQERVRKSALSLDKTNPGWENKIDTEKLDMLSARYCMSGQLGLHDGCNVERGFYLNRDYFSGTCWQSYDRLRDLWKYQVAKRLKTSKALCGSAS